MVEETGALCDLSKARGPRWAVDVEVETFRLFALRVLFGWMRAAGAAGASDFLVDQSPTE